MFIAKVIGNVWATRKHCGLTGKKLLIVRAIEPFSGEFIGEAALAVDGGVGSGTGDVVLVLDEGGCARKILKDEHAPVRTLICGVVDCVSSGERTKKYA